MPSSPWTWTAANWPGASRPLADDVWNAACLNGGRQLPGECRWRFRLRRLGDHRGTARRRRTAAGGPEIRRRLRPEPDPAGGEGELVWQPQVSNAAIGPDLARTTTNGGVHWGMALSGERLLVAAADPERDAPGVYSQAGPARAEPGRRRNALVPGRDPRLRDRRGEQADDRPAEYARRQEDRPRRSSTAAPSTTACRRRCSPPRNWCSARAWTAKFAPLTSPPARSCGRPRLPGPSTADNGIDGHGGAIDVSGQVLADGWLYVQSGYSMFGQLPGNVLLAYRAWRRCPVMSFTTNGENHGHSQTRIRHPYPVEVEAGKAYFWCACGLSEASPSATARTRTPAFRRCATMRTNGQGVFLRLQGHRQYPLVRWQPQVIGWKVGKICSHLPTRL